jgi:hypothetical protein
MVTRCAPPKTASTPPSCSPTPAAWVTSLAGSTRLSPPLSRSAQVLDPRRARGCATGAPPNCFEQATTDMAGGPGPCTQLRHGATTHAAATAGEVALSCALRADVSLGVCARPACDRLFAELPRDSIGDPQAGRGIQHHC